MLVSVSYTTSGQDSLSTEHLIPVTYEFTITDGILKGAASDFFKKETNNAQYTLVGDYPDSKASSEFTNALIPLLKEADYHTMALGVGVPSGRILDSLINEPSNLEANLRALNTQYTFRNNSQIMLPMPDMKSVTDVQFLQKAAEANWSVVGFGYESWQALLLLVDQMYSRLSEEEQQAQKKAYLACQQVLKKLYTAKSLDLLGFVDAVDASQEVQDFLKQIEMLEKTPLYVNAFRRALLRAKMHVQKQFYRKNEQRIKDEKDYLKQELDRIGFQSDKEKLLVKWDRNFLSRGFQPYAFYGIGNTLSELAEYNGSKSLHIAIVPRYQERESSVTDVLQKPNPLDSFLRMGQRDKWVVIDMRDMIENYYYTPVRFLLNETALDFVKRFDLLVIPPVENEIKLLVTNNEQ